jgi:hypothetical protein
VDSADKIQQMWIVIQAMADLAKRHTTNPSATNPGTPATTTPGAMPGGATSDGATPGGARPGGATTGGATAQDATAGGTTAGGGQQAGEPLSGQRPGDPRTADPQPGDPHTADQRADQRPGDPRTADQRPVVRRTADQRRADVVADLFGFMLWNGLDWLGRRLPDQHRRRPHIEVLTPITTLLGIDDDPCELTGYGPIPAEMARRIATDSTWRRILTDPVNGTVLEASTTRHDPGMLVSET